MDHLDLRDIVVDYSESNFKDGIYLADYNPHEDIEMSRKTWSSIYDFSGDAFIDDRAIFWNNKLEDHAKCIEPLYDFDSSTVFLELGCGPAYMSQYLMEAHDAFFIGVDFNYPMLVTLKDYLEKKGFENYLLICCDINQMPIKDNVIDFIYGGGVIEHFKNTRGILELSYRIMKPRGVSFNIVPSCNLSWITKMLWNIPDIPYIKEALDFLHMNILGGRVLKKHFGYELSFTAKRLLELHRSVGFQDIRVAPFAFHPSDRKIGNPLLAELFFKLNSIPSICTMYRVSGTK